MQQLHTDVAQSFWLRFWSEPHQGPHREWRGTIWHEQQADHEKPIAVASPDEAFEFVRRALRLPLDSEAIAAPDIKAPSRKRAFAPLRRLFLLAPHEAEFKTRGFDSGDPNRREVLETAGRTFIDGYNAALLARDVGDVLDQLNAVTSPLRGFFAEGAAMGAAIADSLSLRGNLLSLYIRATEREFIYLACVGAGWALAKTPWRQRAILEPLDTLHGWLAFDGLGFHDAYFKHARIAAGWRRKTTGYQTRAYDQGVGRALWFISGGDVRTAARSIAALAPVRHDDLWSGLGLAMAYAGPNDDADFLMALRLSGASSPAVAQGIAFACEAHARASHIPPATEHAARAVWHRGAGDLAALVREARDRLPDKDADVPRYEIWRSYVARLFETERAA